MHRNCKVASRTKGGVMTIVNDIIDMLNHVIEDVIINRKFSFDFYHYLVDEKISKKDIEEFNSCYFIGIIKTQIEEFESFLEGGDSFIREAYPGYSKPEVRRMKQYLEGLIDAGMEYEKTKKTRKPYTKRKTSPK